MENGRCLLVTGASSSMGRALIKKTAPDYDVILAHFAHNDASLRALNEGCGGKIRCVQADFAKEDDVRRMIEEIRGDGTLPDHIVHLAARPASFLKFGKYTWEDYQAESDISLRSAVLLLQAFLPAMAKAKSGKVLFMLTAFLTGADPKYMSPYITTKYALYGLLKTLTAEYEGKGVAFTAVSPEMTDTAFLDAVPDTVKDIAASAAPDGRLLSPERVAEVMYTLLQSEDAAFRHLYINAAGKVNNADLR